MFWNKLIFHNESALKKIVISTLRTFFSKNSKMKILKNIAILIKTNRI